MNFNFKNIREVYKVATIQTKRAGGILQFGHLGFGFYVRRESQGSILLPLKSSTENRLETNTFKLEVLGKR